MLRRTLVAATLGAALLSAARDASAEDAPAASKSYGVQTLAVDGAATALFTLALLDKELQPTVSAAGIGVYALGAPTVHVVHGRPLRALGDLGFRIAAPLVTTTAAYFLSGGRGGHGPNEDATVNTGMAIGFGLGALGAMAFDALWLARAEPPPAPKTTSAPTFAPGVAPTKNGFAAGISGTF
jgi:hypothetical protein